MMNEVPRAYLHRRLFSEQMNFRRWLLERPPAIVLKFAREYVMREAILTSFGEITFPDGFASAFAEKPEQMKNASDMRCWFCFLLLVSSKPAAASQT